MSRVYREYENKTEFLKHLREFAEANILADGERWDDVVEKELEFAAFPWQYHAELSFEFPKGTGFRLRLVGDRDRETGAVGAVRWDGELYVYAGETPYGYMNISGEKKLRPDDMTAQAIATCNYVGHNCFNPFGLMDR